MPSHWLESETLPRDYSSESVSQFQNQKKMVFQNRFVVLNSGNSDSILEYFGSPATVVLARDP